MIKGIIFDMDGVLIDSNRLHYTIWKKYFKNNYKIKINESEFSKNLGESSYIFTKYFIDKYNLKLKPKLLLEKIREYKTLEFNDGLNLKPGIKNFLEEQNTKFSFALATGADYS